MVSFVAADLVDSSYEVSQELLMFPQTSTYHVMSIPLHSQIMTKCVGWLSYLPKFIMTVFSQAPVFWSLLICWE